MKENDIKIGMSVYVKKSAGIMLDPNKARIITNIIIRKNKPMRIILDNKNVTNPCELTIIPCSQMICKNCLNHKEVKNEKRN